MSWRSAAAPQRDLLWRRVGSGRLPPAIHGLSSALSRDRLQPESFSHSCLLAERDRNSLPLRALGPPTTLVSCHLLLRSSCVDCRRARGSVTSGSRNANPSARLGRSGRVG